MSKKNFNFFYNSLNFNMFFIHKNNFSIFQLKKNFLIFIQLKNIFKDKHNIHIIKFFFRLTLQIYFK